VCVCVCVCVCVWSGVRSGELEQLVGRVKQHARVCCVIAVCVR